MRNAFTLIELLIAMSLGIVIIIAAIAGLRVASQAVTVSTRLSHENALMREGISRAHDEVDFWTEYDDPTLPDAQRPQKNVAGTKGLPFQPFSATWPKAGTWPTVSQTDALSDGDESAQGWDGSYAAFATANPRSWLRSNLIEKNVSDLRFGRYAMFADTADALGTADFSQVLGPDGKTNVGFGPATPPHHWFYRQVKGLSDALGYYGMFEYLPASALYEFYGVYDSSGSTNAGGIPYWTINPSGPFNNNDGGQQTARGKYRNSYMTSFGMLDPHAPSINGNQGTLWNLARTWWQLGYQWSTNPDPGPQLDFNSKSAVPYDLLPLHPVAWPDLTVSVQRFVKNARHVTVSRVHWTSPVTGESAELSFASFGTSLRGARQQRRPDTGWAKWDDDGADHSSDTAYKTLDSY